MSTCQSKRYHLCQAAGQLPLETPCLTDVRLGGHAHIIHVHICMGQPVAGIEAAGVEIGSRVHMLTGFCSALGDFPSAHRLYC